MDVFVAEENNPLIFKCPLCNKKFTQRNLNHGLKHLKRCKESCWIPPEFMCGYCPYQTGIKSKLLNHIQEHVDDIYKCYGDISMPLQFYRLKFQFSSSDSD